MKKNVIKVICIIMALGMLFAVIPCGVAAKGEEAERVFDDVSPDKWFYGDVEYVNEKGLMNGVAEKTFAPDAPLSRAMCATILYRMAGEPEVDDVKLSFADVPEDAWYTDAVKWAYCKEIVNGKAQNTFAPEDHITRAEFATMLFRYVFIGNMVLPAKREFCFFEDGDKVPDYAQTAIIFLYNSEVINGKGNNRFAPNDKVKRSETAALIHRFGENVLKSEIDIFEEYGLRVSAYRKLDSTLGVVSPGHPVPVMYIVLEPSDSTPADLPKINITGRLNLKDDKAFEECGNGGMIYRAMMAVDDAARLNTIYASITMTIDEKTVYYSFVVKKDSCYN